jgi:uroporphyrinogen-III synthase|tara:strand:- start:521 stop:1219 length:699 start_codon:yes stop_codon:yes gene_type:complete
MHILFTRPLEDCKEIMVKFQLLGHEVSHMPLIYVEKKNYDEIDFKSFKAIIFTSSNAIKFLNLKKIDKKINCFCVGSATEKKARNFGFQNTFSAEGNVNNLKELILQNFNSSDGKLLYVSGEIVSNELDKNLILEGYDVKRIVNYTVKHVENLNEDFVKKIKIKMPNIVYVYSQNSALSFLNLIKNYNLINLWMDTNLMCISEKTSSVLNEIKWKKIFIFSPGEEEFLLYKI